VPPPELVEISIARTTGVRRPGIRIHRTTTLEPQDLRKLDGIPVTSPARTLLDLGTVLRPSGLERAFAQAETKRLVRRTDLVALLERHGRRPGAGPLRALLEAEAGPAFTRSEAERKLLELVRAAELPGPKTNARLGAYEVDFLWPRHRLVVEVDGYRFHSQRSAFERDRRRDAELTRRGFTVIRVTWRQLVDEPHAVVARIAAALALASG
jgi:very-short-patch-repair endonuclease